MGAARQQAKIIYGAGFGHVAPGTARVCVHRALDDHLRVSALIAHHARERCGEAVAGEAARACLTPDTPSDERVDALAEVLGRAREAGEGLPLVLVDIDGLLETAPFDTSPEASEASFRRQRERLYRVLVSEAAPNGWQLVRPSPEPSVTEDLAGLVTEPVRSNADALERLTLGVSPAVARVMRGLVALGARRPPEVDARVRAHHDDSDGTPASEQGLLAVAYDALSPAARQTGWRLALSRGDQALNGALGALALSDEPARAPDLLWRGAVEQLRVGGWLVEAGAGRVMMPARLRRFFAERAVWMLPDAMETHAVLARRARDGSLAARLEQHHHAIESDDVEAAKATAVAYGADLRVMAYRRSHRGDFIGAAQIYREITEAYDSRDAYAWEYLGFNLQCAGGWTPDVSQQITDAYERAARLEPQNMLYQGRLLGWQVAQGLELGQIEERVRWLLHAANTRKDIGYAIKPVLDALKRAERHADMRHIVAQWEPRFRHVEALRPHLPPLDAT